MVFPASIADAAPAAAGDTAWLDRIRRAFRLTDSGVIVLVTEAQPARLRDLVLALLEMDIGDAGLHVCVKAPPLLDVPVGATVLLRLRTQDSTWLNYTRPIFAERQWRTVLWDEDGATTEIKATAPDFFDWISHVVTCPAGVPGFAVRGLQTAPRFPGVVWRGREEDLERVLEVAEPGAERTALSLSVPYAELLETVRRAPGWLICRGLTNERDLARLRWALAEIGRTARCVLVEPTVGAPGWWPVGDAFASWEEMLHEIGGDDAAAAALVAALLEREPGTGALTGALRQAGVGLDELAAELRSATDPGATLARLAHARGLISTEHLIERQAAPAVLRALDHDADIEDARAQRNAMVHAALTAWHTGTGRADDWSLTEAELSSWAGTAPAEVPALATERPAHWNAVYWLEATLGRDAPSPAALAWARELAHADVVAHWEQAYGPGRSALGDRQMQDANASERPRAEAPGATRQRMQRDHAHRLAALADLLRRRGRHDEAERLARQTAEVDNSVKVLIITGDGKAFCAGADLEYLNEMKDYSSLENEKDSRELAELFLMIYNFPKIVIAAVNGAAIAGGCGLASVCDIILADEKNAKFGYSEVKIGFIPAIVSTFLIRRVGEGMAKQLLLTGEIIEAKRAIEIGLANYLYNNALEFSLHLASELKANSSTSLKMTKDLIRNVSGLTVEDAVEYSIGLNTISRTSADFKKGLNNFLNKK